MRSLRMPAWQAAAVAAFTLLFLLANAAWLWHFRRAQPLDIDEAGYLSIALVDYWALLQHGVLGFIGAIEQPGIQAPVTTALAGLLFWFTGPHQLAAFAVPLLCAAACIPVSYALARALGMHRGRALLPALLVAACPMLISYSRAFTFAMPTTLVASLALLALLRSERMRRPGWALVFGVCVGLLPLARTMTLSFLPPLLVGALCYIYGAGFAAGARRGGLFLLALLVGAAVALSWYIPNGAYVLHYLLGFGYGGRAAEFNPGRVPGGFAAFLFTLTMLGDYVCLPQFLFLLAAFPVGLWLFIRAGGEDGLFPACAALLRTPALPVLAFCAGVLLVLSSTANKGDGFIAPAVPAMLVLACLGFDQLSAAPRWRAAVAALVVIIAGASAIPTSGLRMPWPAAVMLPGFGQVALTPGTGGIQDYEKAGGYGSADPDWPVSRADGKAFTATARAIAIALRGQTTAFAFRDRLLNVNSVGLSQIMLGLPRSALIQIEPAAVGETTPDVVQWLRQGDAATACLLLLSNETAHQFLPVIPPAITAAAAAQAHFIQTESGWDLPDAEHLSLWRRNSPGCPVT